ncbi:MAG TPA: MgtC/SapB family protein [Verrucomicrobiales bacterium]|nr:MgtC/SapB family protein [Verrucomicrobiales bacterium]
MDPDLLTRLGLALGIGLLVGMQRERVQSALGGVRTFTLVAALGALCGLMAESHGGWIVAAGLVALAIVALTSNLMKREAGSADAGMTTEVAVLLLFALGAYLMGGNKAAGVVLGGVLAVLLHYKGPMHAFIRRIREEDLRAVMQFVLITLVILPVLPRKTFGPYDVFNPFEVWLMVVLIVGIGLAGYAAYLLLGSRGGTVAGGLLGGLISSTATTVTSARLARRESERTVATLVIILLASGVAYLRAIIEIAVVAPVAFPQALWPMTVPPLMLIGAALVILARSSKDLVQLPPPSNPAQLRTAIVFGLLYALILFAVAAAERHMGRSGLYGVAVVSGLTDMDAITLSTSQLIRSDTIPVAQGWRLVLTASLANLIFKGGMAWVLGGRRLGLRVALVYSAILAVGVGMIFLWPDGGMARGAVTEAQP